MKVDAAARTILSGLKEAGINLIASLPDINLAELLRLIEQDRDVIHVPLCREEEGIGICAGAYLVGKKCAVVMQNGGFFNSNNAIVSTLLQYQIPLLLMIYYAGDFGDRDRQDDVADAPVAFPRLRQRRQAGAHQGVDLVLGVSLGAQPRP